MPANCRQFAILVAVAMAAVVEPCHAEDHRTVTVAASGLVMADPDSAQISTGVVTEAATARQALAINAGAMQALIAELTALGVAPGDIRTVSFHVEPQFAGGPDRRPPTLTGYRVTNQLRLTVRDLKRLGEILDKTLTAGANQAVGMELRVFREESLRDEARRQAIDNATRRARLYAEAAGAKLGKVRAITEDTGLPEPRHSAASRAALSAGSLEAGTTAAEARVTVVYELE